MSCRNLKKECHHEVFYTNFFLKFDRLFESVWCGSISAKTILICFKNFLNFWFDAIEKQATVNLSRCRSRTYASIVLSDSEVTFHREGDDAAFCPSSNCLLGIYGVAKSRYSTGDIRNTYYEWQKQKLLQCPNVSNCRMHTKLTKYQV